MTKIIGTTFLALSLLTISISSCKKEDAAPASNPTPNPVNNRVVKFEITGNYSGSVNVAYTNASGGTESSEATSFPWTKDITYNASIAGIGAGGGTSVAGAAGQTLTLKIYSAGVVVSTGSAVAAVNGTINLPTLAHSF